LTPRIILEARNGSLKPLSFSVKALMGTGGIASMGAEGALRDFKGVRREKGTEGFVLTPSSSSQQFPAV
jgi:hypothetical protein